MTWNLAIESADSTDLISMIPTILTFMDGIPIILPIPASLCPTHGDGVLPGDGLTPAGIIHTVAGIHLTPGGILPITALLAGEDIRTTEVIMADTTVVTGGIQDTITTGLTGIVTKFATEEVPTLPTMVLAEDRVPLPYEVP